MRAESGTVVWRSGRELGAAVREARDQMGLTQAQLARRARVGLKFLYELESGKDTLRADKVLDVLAVLALDLVVTPAGPAAVRRERPNATTRAAMHEARQVRAQYGAGVSEDLPITDYIGMACTTAGVSLRKALAPDELVHALLHGKVTPGKQAHFVVLLEEAPPALLQGLIAQVGAWGKPGQVARNVRKIAGALGVRLKESEWLKSA
ncbi:MAG: helix-turn-helix domain-containing protein [Proteobacteria bacterium]|nr:helix-turn-helix domain-containing protein [Pseudomonadota bacterium]